MPSTILDNFGIKREVDALDFIPPDEGSLKQIYGRIGNYKTYFATLKAFELLGRGQVVKTNWRLFDDKEKNLSYSGYDERNYFLKKLLCVLGWKRKFSVYPKENWELFSILPEWSLKKGFKSFSDWFAHQTDCTIMIDEGHMAEIFDSYMMTKLPIGERIKITSSRHFDRSVWVISQRPSAIHINYRANVNQFYKCEVISQSNFFLQPEFLVTEFQDTNESDKPDETREEIRDKDTGEITEWKYKLAVSSEKYRASLNLFNKYDSKYLREGMKSSQKANILEFEIGQKEALKNLFKK